jgi:hypothetical protein
MSELGRSVTILKILVCDWYTAIQIIRSYRVFTAHEGDPSSLYVPNMLYSL